MARFSAQIEGVEIIGLEPHEGSMGSMALSWLKTQLSKLPFLGQIRYARYRIRVSHAGKHYVTTKRFSDFVAFYKRLKALPTRPSDVDFPQNTLLRVFTEQHLESRKDALNAYLASIYGAPALAGNAGVLLEFLKPSTDRPSGFILWKAMQRDSASRNQLRQSCVELC